MLVSLLISLAIATLAIYISLNATDEIVQIGAAIITLLCLFLSLVFAPTLIKFLIVLALLLKGKPTLDSQNNSNFTHYEFKIKNKNNEVGLIPEID